MNPSLSVWSSSTIQQMMTTLTSHVNQQRGHLFFNLHLFPQTPLFSTPPMLLLESCLTAPNQQGAFFLYPSLHFLLSRLTYWMELFPSPLQGGSHRQATVSPLHLPLFPLLLIQLHLHFTDPLHLWWCHHVFHLLCSDSYVPYSRLLLLLGLSHCLLGLRLPNIIPFSHRQTSPLWRNTNTRLQ